MLLELQLILLGLYFLYISKTSFDSSELVSDSIWEWSTGDKEACDSLGVGY